MDDSRPGQALAATLEEPGFYAGDPFPHYARLRREAPLAWNAQLGYWAVSKHADVVAISRDPESVLLGQGNPDVRDRRRVPEPAHDDAHRSARPHAVPQARAARLRAVAHAGAGRRGCAPAPTSSSARVETGEPFDAVETLAVPFPLWIIAELLGIPESDWPRFYQWSEASIPGATDWPPEECQRLQAEMHEYLLDTTRARRTDPRDDIISVLAEAEVEGESLRDDELVMFLNQLLVAGNETTRHAISGGIAALAERPDQWQRLVEDRVAARHRDRRGPALDDARDLVHAHRDARYRRCAASTSRPATRCCCSTRRRTATKTNSAPTPTSSTWAAIPNHEVALGFGPHFCLGAALARIEISAMLDALLDRFTVARARRRSRTHGVVRDRRHLARAGRVLVDDDHAPRLGVPRRCGAARPAGARGGRRARRSRRPTASRPRWCCSRATSTSRAVTRIANRRVRRTGDRGVPAARKLDRRRGDTRARSSRSRRRSAASCTTPTEPAPVDRGARARS